MTGSAARWGFLSSRGFSHVNDNENKSGKRERERGMRKKNAKRKTGRK